MPFDRDGKEYHPICLYCGIQKESNESVMCIDCAVATGAIQPYDEELDD